MPERVADDRGRPKHGEASDYFNRLVLDLKKQMLGFPHDPITMDRCREPDRFF